MLMLVEIGQQFPLEQAAHGVAEHVEIVIIGRAARYIQHWDTPIHILAGAQKRILPPGATPLMLPS
ncbi:hypothetical protein GCM10007897_23600 [Sphingobium jiangsuense]|nr:hypothetical protein GCM10007897_23600 [Sphingobium jiangsuense]